MRFLATLRRAGQLHGGVAEDDLCDSSRAFSSMLNTVGGLAERVPLVGEAVVLKNGDLARLHKGD